MAMDLARAGDGPAGPGVRRRARRELREVRDTRAQHGVRHQRLRRDPARPLGVGREAARRQPARRRATAWVLAGELRRRRHHRGARLPGAHRAAPRRCAPSSSGTRASTSRMSSRTFPRSTGRSVQRDVKKAQRKDHRRAVAKLTGAVDGQVRVRRGPAARRPHRQHRSRHGRRPADHRQLRETLSHDVGDLFDRFRIVDVARKVVGVGSVGTRCWICLFEGPRPPEGDRMILQVKEAQASVLEPYVGASHTRPRRNAGRRRPASDPGRERHLPRMDRGGRERPRVLRAPTLGRQGFERPDDDGASRTSATTAPVRHGARTRARAHR